MYNLLEWDATVTDSLSPSLVGPGSSRAASAAVRAEAAKIRKYDGLSLAYNFRPLAFETLGGPGPLTADLIVQVGETLERVSGDRRLGRFLAQRLSLDVQRGDAISVQGTMTRWLEPRWHGG